MFFGQTVKISGGEYAPTMDVGVIEVDTSTSSSTIYLPNIIGSTADSIGYKLVIVDISNNASVNPITIVCSNGQKVNGSNFILLNNNGVTAGFIPFGNFYWIGNYDTGNSTPTQPAYNLIQDEGVDLPQRQVLDFVGKGVMATDDPLNGKTIIEIPKAYDLIQEEGINLIKRQTLNFVGIGVTASDDPLNQKTIVNIQSVVNYSNVFFVDPIHGNDSTALQGRFDKPYANLINALFSANSTAPTINNRALVYVRKGQYNSIGAVPPFNNCDVYCEAGVVFTGVFQLWDTWVGSAVNFNWYGYAKYNLLMSSMAFRFQYASTVLIEGDTFVNLGAICLAFNVTVGTSNIIFNFNSMESTLTLGSGFGFTWRNNCNATLNVKNYIKVNQESHDIRANHSGEIIVNCPRNIMTALNVYGGNFKNILSSGNSSATSYFTVNGDLISETSYLGGFHSMILVWSSSQCQVTINGNVYGNDSVGLWGANVGVGRIVLNGDLTSNINTIITQGNGLVVVKNGTIRNINLAGNSIYMYGGTLYLMNCSLYRSMVDGTMIGLDAGGITNLEVINCVSKSEGLLGEFVTSTVAKTCQFTNVVANKPLNANVTNQLAQGLTIEPLLEVPRF